MLAIAWDFLSKNYPQITSYFFTALIVGFVVWYLTKFTMRTNRICKNEFPVVKLTLERIDKSLVALNAILTEKKYLMQSFYRAESPIKINEIGRELLRESFAQELLDENTNNWLAELENNRYDSPFEVEKSAYALMLNKMDNPEFKKIQTFAYNHKSFKDLALVYSDILFVMGLYLRDKYLERHAEII